MNTSDTWATRRFLFAFLLMAPLFWLTAAPELAQAAKGNHTTDPGVSAPEIAHPDPTIARLDVAIAHYTAGNYGAAEALLTEIAADRKLPTTVQSLVLFNRGAARLNLDRFEDAIADFDAAEALGFPRAAQLHLARGVAWELLGRHDLAAEAFVNALAANPRDPMVQAKVRDFFDEP